MKRSPLRSKPKPSTTDRDAAHAWYVATTQGKACVVCNRRGSRITAHHCVPQTVLKNEFPNGATIDGVPYSLEDLRWWPGTGIPVCLVPCHLDHESGAKRIPANKIPITAFRFAVALGLEARVGPTIYPR